MSFKASDIYVTDCKCFVSCLEFSHYHTYHENFHTIILASRGIILTTRCKMAAMTSLLSDFIKLLFFTSDVVRLIFI